jgi:hypothetical protein
MTIENYLIIENNVVTNIVVWDGDTQGWTPPVNSIQLPQAGVTALVWQLNADKTDYVLTEIVGATDSGFTWNGTVCTTNKPKPELTV